MGQGALLMKQTSWGTDEVIATRLMMKEAERILKESHKVVSHCMFVTRCTHHLTLFSSVIIRMYNRYVFIDTISF